MSKFGGVDWMILLQEKHTKKSDKDAITRAGIKYLSKAKISIARAFSTRERDTLSGFTNKYLTFTPLDGLCLAPMTINDKLFIIAHAEPNEVGPYDPGALASKLHDHGARQIGLVTFKCCNVAVGTYLESFIAACNRVGLVIGWAKGYRGSAATLDGIDGLGEAEKVDVVGGLGGEHTRSVLRPTERIRNKYGRDAHGDPIIAILKGEDRYKIVPGPGASQLAAVGRYS
jgi:hypothetical protein